MMSADYKVQRLYDEFIRDVTKSADNWKNFLRITGRIYRYEFDNILMVYAQRPNAILVGDYDSWKKVGRYVKRGSRGIAIFPSKILKPHMRYVFDISDTGTRQNARTQHSLPLQAPYHGGIGALHEGNLRPGAVD